MAQPIRVVVANQPRLMRELVLGTINEHPDIEIVGEIQKEEEIAQAVHGTHPDFLIIALDESGQPPRPLRRFSATIPGNEDSSSSPGAKPQYVLPGLIRYSFNQGRIFRSGNPQHIAPEKAIRSVGV